MFFQRDYILRMIEMMGDLMRRIRELMNDLARIKLLDEACRAHTGISLETAEGLTGESLTELLQPMPRLMMSEILFAKAETVAVQAEEREALLYKSLCLLASLWQEGPLCEIRSSRLMAMKEEVLPQLTPSELMDCARFLAEAERFADMEDAIFQAAEALGEVQDELRREGTLLLEKAAAAKPDALALAQTTREELLEAAKELSGGISARSL